MSRKNRSDQKDAQRRRMAVQLYRAGTPATEVAQRFHRSRSSEFKLSICYGESSIWNNTSAHRLTQWARHEDHDIEIDYQFYDGRKRKAAQ